MATNTAIRMATRHRVDDGAMKWNLARRSRRNWAMRAALALGTALLGYLTVTSSLAAVESKRSPALAHALAPGDGQITAALAADLFKNDPVGDRASLPSKLARQAIAQDATAVPAVVVLGTQALLRGERLEGRRLFYFAQSLSRRDFQTQLWFIEDAVTRGDIPSAIKHYDIALRTSRSASTILYPILAAALAERSVRSNLILTLAKNPIWEPSFIAFAIASDTDPRIVADLLAEMRSAKLAVSPEASASIINRLLLVGKADDAWRYYSSLRSGIRTDRSRDPRFGDSPVSMSRFDWVPTENNDIAVMIQRRAGGGLADLSVPGGQGGALLTQAQMLPPGSYLFTTESSGIDQLEAPLLYWTLTCRDGRELGRVSVPPSGQRMVRTTGSFRVPPGCPIQALTLVAQPSGGFTDLTGQIGRAELVPAS